MTATAPPQPGTAKTAPRHSHLPAGLSPERARLVGLGILCAAVIGLAVGLSLGLSGGPSTPPDTGAARLVPAGALGYVNVSLDRSRPGVDQSLRTLSGLPGFPLARAAVDARMAALFGSAHPAWLGDEAALAVVPQTPSGSRADLLDILAVRGVGSARRALSALPAPGRVDYRGTAIRTLSGGVSVALLGRYVVAGQLASVEQAIAVEHGAASLSGSAAFQRASAGEPAARVLDLYAPAAGVSELLGGRHGLLGAIRDLLVAPGLTSLSASLSAAPGGLRLQVHRVFASGAARSTVAPFDPSQLRGLPAGAALALGTTGLPAAAPRLLIAASELGVGSGVGPLLARLGGALQAEKYNVAPLLKLFSGQTAISVVDAGGHPSLLLLTHTDNPAGARIVLASLAPPLASLFPAATAGPGSAPLFTGRQIHGIIVHQLQLGPGLQVDYTVFHHLVGVSTSVSALTSLAPHGRSLGGTSAYQTAFGPSRAHAGSLVFADLKVLIRLGEQTGLLRGVGFARLAPDLDRISVIGLRARSDKTESTSELYFKIP